MLLIAVAWNITEPVCGQPRRDRSRELDVTTFALSGISGSLMLLRLAFKCLVNHQAMLHDDWSILASLLLGLACALINYPALNKFGLGKDIWTLEPSIILQFGIFFYVQQVLYLVLLASVKLTFLLFYLRVFPARCTQRLLWATIVINVHFALGFVVLSIVQCRPIRYYWAQYVEDGHGTCIPIHSLAWMNGAVSVAMDLWMIMIPLSQVSVLHLHWRKKLMGIIMFLTGIL